MKNLNPVEMFNSWQAMFQPPAAMRNAATQRMADFWSNQEKILESMEEYASRWFERRHAGARSAAAAARHIGHAESPSDAIREYQNWAMGCFDRAMDDHLTGCQHLMSMGELFAKPASSSDESNKIDATRGESRERPVSRPRAA